jgi:hypothetical protein
MQVETALSNRPGITSVSRFEYDIGPDGQREDQGGKMDAYAPVVERMMKRLFGSLKESDRRRYAAIEAAKLGHGGIEYIADVLGCDPKTIRLGLGELEGENDLDTGRSRKKGAGGNG